MTADGPAWVREEAVVDALNLADAIAVLERGLPLQATGQAATMAKTHAAWGGGHTLHAVGGVLPGSGLVGAKVWAHAGGAEPLLVLWDAHDGRCIAVVEAFALGQLRTAAMSAVATRWLASPDASVLAVIGSGRQADAQAAAVAAVRPIRRVLVHSPTPEHREAFATRLREQLAATVDAVASVEQAVAEADVVTTVTRARMPFLRGDHVRAGVHVNAVGAITPERRELDASLVARCPQVVTDSAVAARELAVELAGAADLVELHEVIGRPRPPGPVTLFKPLGLGLADVLIGAAVLERVAPMPVVPRPARKRPRLTGVTIPETTP